MARRKNLRRGGNRNRFKGVSMKYNVIYDISTEQYAPTILGIHTPTGNTPYRMMKPLFDAYKRYKYIGCDITIVNGSRILNPSSAYTTATGMQTADPRDALDPIMFKGCHGQDLGMILNQIYGTTGNVFTDVELDKKKLADALTNYYYQSLADTSWKKGNINSTLRIPGLHPLVYSVSANAPLNPSFNALSNETTNITDTWTGSSTPSDTSAQPQGNHTGSQLNFGGMQSPYGYVVNPDNINTSNLGTMSMTYPRQFFTTRLHRLGWLDTKNPFQESSNSQGINSAYNPEVNMLGKYFMGVLMLPSAKKSYNYLRMIVTHKWAFSGLRTISEGMVNTFDMLGDLEETSVASPLYFNDMANVENPVRPDTASVLMLEDPIEEVEEIGVTGERIKTDRS